VKYIFRLATLVTAPSEFLAEAVRECFGITCEVVPNILDGSVFHHRQRTNLRPRILVTRHMEEIYGVEVALRAFRVVQSHFPEASLWIAGTGSQEPNLRRMVSDWNLSNVRFLGYVPHSELGAIYDECDILLNASFVDNFPGSLLEASGAGLVVVSTGAGGIPFMFRHEESALLVKPGDWAGLAIAVERVLQTPSVAHALAKAAANLADSCRWPIVRKKLYAAYGFTVAPPPAPAQLGPD
jgi:glycosyltransferase involved in cell wall biosynthesis